MNSANQLHNHQVLLFWGTQWGIPEQVEQCDKRFAALSPYLEQSTKPYLSPTSFMHHYSLDGRNADRLR